MKGYLDCNLSFHNRGLCNLLAYETLPLLTQNQGFIWGVVNHVKLGISFVS